MLLTFGPEATVRRMMQSQILRHQDCSQRIFTAYMEAGQTSALARHLAYSTLNCPSPVLKSSGLRLTAMFAIVFQFSFGGREQSNWAKTNWRIFLSQNWNNLQNSLEFFAIWLNYNYWLHFIGSLFCNCKNKAFFAHMHFYPFYQKFQVYQKYNSIMNSQIANILPYFSIYLFAKFLSKSWIFYF